MNTVRISVKKKQHLPLSGFLNSLYYTFPIGMFLTACNFMFEFVRNYYFNWWIVILPTLAILVVSNLYEALLVYHKIGTIKTRRRIFNAKPGDYTMSKSKMIGELV